MFQTEKLENGGLLMRPERVMMQDIDKMRSTLRSLVREWAVEGETERAQAFTPLLDEVRDYFEVQLGR